MVTPPCDGTGENRGFLTLFRGTMAIADITMPPPLPSEGAVRFLGKDSAYWRLRIKGAALLLVTLGIYRFWLATDVRRFLWSSTEIAGDSLEYNGLATELLVGFLFAVAILVPLYMALAIVALEIGAIGGKSVVLGFPLLALLAEYALYRARRYRLTRTVFRGLRFDQHGSAWGYAIYALAWWALAIVTLGLAYPWAQAALQRYKMRRTSYGDLPGRFDATGSSLFVRGLPLWLVVVVPLIVAVVSVAAMIDWDALSTALASGDDDALSQFESSSQFDLMIGILVTSAGASVIFAILLYPLFQAISLRWWISGLRFGAIAVTSKLRIGLVYRVYLRFVLFILLLAVLASVAGVVGLALIGLSMGRVPDSALAELAATTIMVGLYVVFALGISTIFQVAVTLGLWRLAAQSAQLSGVQQLDTVHAAGTPSSALGEGLADALKVGDF
jgi:uncharacterized membrane protein YjgN (DUF898 family)